nr:hypothetical protein [Roseicitreum antarcticum]
MPFDTLCPTTRALSRLDGLAFCRLASVDQHTVRQVIPELCWQTFPLPQHQAGLHVEVQVRFGCVAAVSALADLLSRRDRAALGDSKAAPLQMGEESPAARACLTTAKSG